MQFTSKLSVALLAILAAGGEANHQALHGRKFFHPRGLNSTTPASTSTVVVYPTPIESSSAAGDSISAITSTTIPLSTGAPGSGAPGSGDSGDDNGGQDVTITYTLGSGSTKSVVTTTIHKTSTDLHTVFAVCCIDHITLLLSHCSRLTDFLYRRLPLRILPPQSLPPLPPPLPWSLFLPLHLVLAALEATTAASRRLSPSLLPSLWYVLDSAHVSARLSVLTQRNCRRPLLLLLLPPLVMAVTLRTAVLTSTTLTMTRTTTRRMTMRRMTTARTRTTTRMRMTTRPPPVCPLPLLALPMATATAPILSPAVPRSPLVSRPASCPTPPASAVTKLASLMRIVGYPSP